MDLHRRSQFIFYLQLERWLLILDERPPQPDVDDQKPLKKKKPATMSEDAKALSMIRQMFKHYLEACFDDIMKEERRSAIIAREEDEMEAKLIAEEEERERQRKLLKLRHDRRPLKKKKPATMSEDAKALSMIRQIIDRYVGHGYDNRDLEACFDDIMKEDHDAIIAREEDEMEAKLIVREEDEMEAKLIAEEEEQERQRKLLKLRHLCLRYQMVTKEEDCLPPATEPLRCYFLSSTTPLPELETIQSLEIVEPSFLSPACTDRYVGHGYDNRDLEACFDDIMKEERRSARIAREEDEMEAKLIAEEEERERQRKLLKLRHLCLKYQMVTKEEDCLPPATEPLRCYFPSSTTPLAEFETI
ncbi:hypothetical protein DY000_02013491 [Brassica cretica]|uniref:Uncharacterized protein n=1 Tax=Brassica cretica TaxID=69181 RepID=A0ABQ7D068_BRACR|nr:hypothetical protein DY000_02013491 [Brassica cretica]